MVQFIQQVQIWDGRTILSIISRKRLSLNTFMKLVSSMGDGYVWMVFIAGLYDFTDVTLEWLSIGVKAFFIELTCYKIIKQSTSRKDRFATMPISSIL